MYFLNLIARCIKSSETNSSQPEIVGAISTISESFHIDKSEKILVKKAIATIMTYKSAILYITRNKPERGRANFNDQTLQLLCKKFSSSLFSGVSVNSASAIYMAAKLVLSRFVEKIIYMFYREFKTVKRELTEMRREVGVREGRIMADQMDDLEQDNKHNIEKLSQINAATRMDIHQSTFQRTLTRARKKITDALVNGKAIKIKGGDYKTLKSKDFNVLKQGGILKFSHCFFVH